MQRVALVAGSDRQRRRRRASRPATSAGRRRRRVRAPVAEVGEPRLVLTFDPVDGVVGEEAGEAVLGWALALGRQHPLVPPAVS